MEDLFMPSKRPVPVVITGYLSALFLSLLLVACGGTNNSPTTPTAAQLIKNAQAAVVKVSSYHFAYQATHPGTSSTLAITGANGDVAAPNKLQAVATVNYGGATIQTQIIAIGNTQYIDLLGTWTQTTGLIDPTTLSDTTTLAALLGKVTNLTTPVDATVNGVSCWSTSGKLDPALLSGITGGGAPAGTQDDVKFCFGKSDSLPYQLIITGIAATGDTAQTTRTFDLSKFNETISISVPTVTATVTANP